VVLPISKPFNLRFNTFFKNPITLRLSSKTELSSMYTLPNVKFFMNTKFLEQIKIGVI